MRPRIAYSDTDSLTESNGYSDGLTESNSYSYADPYSDADTNGL
jgi:hypothetical protein